MSGPFFSLVIPTFNRRGLLGCALLSVWAQHYTDYEIIVVDDGSTDDTWGYLAALGDRVRPLGQRNRGPAAARNAGAEIARGEYLAFLDSDDILLPDALASYALAIQEASKPSLVRGCLVEFGDGHVLPSGEGAAFTSRRFPTYLEAAAEGLFAGSCQLAVRRDLFLRAGGFDEVLQVGEDHDFVLRVGGAPGFVEITSPPCVARRRHAGSISRDWQKLSHGLAVIVKRAEEGIYGRNRVSRAPACTIASAHARSGSLALARGGYVKDAALLYARSLAMNVRNARWRYLAAFPFILAWHALGRLGRRAPVGASLAGTRL